MEGSMRKHMTRFWLLGWPVTSIAAVAAVALVPFFGLMRIGVGVKASSEACL